MAARRLRSIYLRYLDAVNAHDLDRLDEFVHDRLVVNGEPISRNGFVDAIEGQLDAVDGFTWHLEDLVVEGDRLASRLTDSGTPVKEWLGLRPTGAGVRFSEFCVYHFRGDRFDQMWLLLDRATIERQLGVLPAK